jgi:hypothetical protein
MGEELRPAEFGANPEDLAAFSTLVADIAAHNDQFSVGAVLGRAIGRMQAHAEHTQSLTSAGAGEEEAAMTAGFVAEDIDESVEQGVERELLGMTTAQMLAKAGLALSPVRRSVMYMHAGRAEPLGKVRLSMADGGAFVGFLDAVDPAIADDDFKRSAAVAAHDIAAEAEQAILNGETAIAAESLAYTDGILRGLDKLGLHEDPARNNLQDIATYHAQGVVIEWLDARESGLLRDVDPEYYGPSGWQRDSSSQSLGERWRRILDTVAAARSNPNGAELAADLAARAQAHLAAARADWAVIETTRAYGPDYNPYGEKFSNVFARIQQGLDRLSRG